MHPCLQSYEIWEVIFSFIRPERTRDLSVPDENSQWIKRATLLRIALTCKTFKDIGLSALWYRLSDLSVLIRCTGPVGSSWKWEDSYYNVLASGRMIHLTRDLLPEEVQTLLGYAQRVREYDERLHVRSRLSEDASLALHRLTDRGYLLPNLCSVLIQERSPMAHLLDLLVSPNVYTVLIRTLEYTPSYTPYLDKLANLSAPVMTLELPSLANLDTRSLLTVINILLRWNHLTRIHLTNPPESIIQHIAKLRSLKFLKLQRARKPNSGDGVGAPALDLPNLNNQSGPTFPGLVALTIRDETLSWPSDFMTLFRPGSPVQSIWLNAVESHGERTPFRDWEHVMYRTTQVCGPELQSLFISDVYTGQATETRLLSFPIAWLLRLQPFSNMVQINITYPGGCEVHDPAIHLLALALPKLRTFRLLCRFVNPRDQSFIDTPKTTLASLISFDQECPNLQELALAYDATSNKIPIIAPKSGSKLTCLEIYQSMIDDSKAVAGFLGRMFPAGIRCQIIGHNPHREMWQEVQGSLNPKVGSSLLRVNR